jgi:hypothetical protein
MLLAAAVLTVGAIAALLLALDGDGSGESATPSTTEAVRASTTVATTTTLLRAGIVDAVDDAADFVEALRGRSFTTRPAVVVVTDTEFDQMHADGMAAAQAADPDTFRRIGVMQHGFGLVGPADDVVEVETALRSIGQLATYDGGVLVVRERETTPQMRLALVHELTNALDDQAFDFGRPELANLDADAFFAFEALVEGDASRAERLYRETFSSSELEELDDALEQRRRLLEEAGVPVSISVLWDAPAKYGEAFVDGLFEQDGNAAIDAAFSTPPTTSEQVFYVDSYYGREPNRPIFHPVPDPDGEFLAEGPLGQVHIMAILRSVHDEETAWQAADGWAGDWFVAWAKGTSSCIRVTMVMETFDEAKELKAAFDVWGPEQFGRAVVFSEDDRVVVTNCVG